MRALAVAISLGLSACASNPEPVNVREVLQLRQASPATLVQLLNSANAEPKAELAALEGRACLEFAERHVRLRNHHDGNEHKLPYHALTYTLTVARDATVALVRQQDRVGRSCAILVYPPNPDGEPTPDQRAALYRVATALYSLGAQVAEQP